MTPQKITSDRLAELLARVRAEKKTQESQEVQEEPTKLIEVSNLPSSSPEATSTDKYGNSITYNSKQLEFITLATAGKSCILIGAAGTGKTTCMKGTVSALVQSGRIPQFSNSLDHKYLVPGSAGIIIIAYTRRATNNIRKNLPKDLQGNCITIHKTLEYQPVVYEDVDSEGNTVTKRTFEPTRHHLNPLPDELTTIIIEEASMVSVELFNLILAALPNKDAVQFIFLGDIQQLPPVFGAAILGYKMCELPTIELTEVYRQALESPIIKLAHRILSGVPIPPAELESWNVQGKLKLHPWKKKLSSEVALHTAAKFFTAALDSGDFNPDEDIILIPYNKAFGTDELNKFLANHLAKTRGVPTYEIIAGFNKHYYSVGDKVLYDKEDAIITKISPNPSYAGKKVQPESHTLDYWGYDSAGHKHTEQELSEEQIEFLISQIPDSNEERVRQASHKVTLKMLDSEREVILDTASDLNAMILGYAITVHKSQGSEWGKVFLVLHQSHATMLQRELLYTAVTRAKESLYVICEPESFTSGIVSQRIKGNTLEEKIEYFKGKELSK